jgi:predicted HicB family RNase H-like nuclease
MKENTLEYKGYLAEVGFSADDEVFYGKIFGLNDLVTFEADSAKELKTAFIEAVEDYLETCAELQKQPEKLFKGSFNVRTSSVLHKAAALIAARNKQSLNDFINKAILFAVNHPKEIEQEQLS